MQRRAVLFVLAILSVSAVAHGGLIYTDEISFVDDLVSGYWFDDFDDLTSGNQSQPLQRGNSAFAVNVTSPNTTVTSVGGGGSGKKWLRADSKAGTLVFTFDGVSPNPVTAVGGYFFTDDEFDGQVTITLDDGTTQVYTSNDDTSFRGFANADGTPIKSLTLTAQSKGYPTVNDFYIGSNKYAAAIPEPSVLGLLGVGVAGFLARRLRRKRSKA